MNEGRKMIGRRAMKMLRKHAIAATLEVVLDVVEVYFSVVRYRIWP